MTPAIKLSGNLGERHRCFNSLVRDAFLQNTPLPPDYPEEPVLDRLFKIELASKQKNVDYIIHTLKDDDMLFVNRALKSLWLLDPEHAKIINPIFLEQELFPEMIMPAVNKMKHWIKMNLHDPERCKEFYKFYKERNFNVAANFLQNCSKEYILGEANGALDKMTPKLLKRLSEGVPQISKIYYDNLNQNQNVLKFYLANESNFFDNVKYLLKSDADIFFYILENFASEEFTPFNALLTKYIMNHHKNRFDCKPELYTKRFLNINALARCLSSEEIKDLVLKLARAEYLNSWFSYQNVEPLIKRLGQQERTVFKKLVFVDKDIGTTIKEWPYPIPTPPKLTPQTKLFEDRKISVLDDYDECDYEEYGDGIYMAMKSAKHGRTTRLDQLFDKYRFCNYKQTVNELQKQLKAESSPQNRQFMLLVLVSKSGGRMEDLTSFLELLSQFKNEPVHIRATIIRSLVKRAFIWRLPSEYWTKLLAWGHGLGLDGRTPEAACNEGLSAVVIRDLLADVKPSATVWENYLSDFDTLKDYSFTVEERRCVSSRLLALLLSDAQSESKEPNFTKLNLLLDTLEAYQIRFDEYPGTVDLVASAVRKYRNDNDENLRDSAECILRRLYSARVGRKLLIKDYFEMIQTNESYVNALRHDISILENTEKLEKLIAGRELKHGQFFRKLALYFMEANGLGEKYRAVLEQRATTEPGKAISNPMCYFSENESENQHIRGRQTLAMPLALLSGLNFTSLLKVLDAAPQDTAERRMAAALRSNAHLVRPAFNLESFGWRKAGAKAVANRVTICRQRDVEGYLKETLSWRQTFRLAVVLAKRVNKERDAFEVFASKRPGAALQVALKYFRREGDNSDSRIWEMVKSNISKAESRQLRSYLKNVKTIPAIIKAEYCFLVYLAFKDNDPSMALEAFGNIPAILPDINDQYVYDTNDAFLNQYLTDDYPFNNGEKIKYFGLHIEMIAKFLVLSTSEEMLNERIKRVGLPLLNWLKDTWKERSIIDNEPIDDFLDYFLYYLRYNKAFFSNKYVSCLSLFEVITEWMHTFLPIEIWFDKYVTVHLTILYFKSVKHCIKENSDLFSEESKKVEGARMLGTIFGKFISNEVEELNQKYFPTVTEVYASSFVDYYNEYINRNYCDACRCVEEFTKAVLDGLMMTKSKTSCILARYIFDTVRYRMNSKHVADMLRTFKKSGIEELVFLIDEEEDEFDRYDDDFLQLLNLKNTTNT